MKADIKPEQVNQAVNELVDCFGFLRHRMGFLWQSVCTLQVLALLREAKLEPIMPIAFRAQNGEDALIWSLLGNRLDGFFIEAGAFDGVNLSATYALEAMGWRGILVEPQATAAAKCRRNRPNSRVVEAALSSPENLGKKADLHRTVDIYGGALSYLDGVVLADGSRERESLKNTVERVNMTTLDEILKDHDAPIDAVVLDVEGHEAEALAGFDIDRWRPKLLLVEDTSMGDCEGIDEYMKDKPYAPAGWNENNRIYLRADIYGTAVRNPALAVWP